MHIYMYPQGPPQQQHPPLSPSPPVQASSAKQANAAKASKSEPKAKKAKATVIIPIKLEVTGDGSSPASS